jgi:hypothetical protein
MPPRVGWVIAVLSDDLLEAMTRYEAERPRHAQITLGPSDLGGCREYIRNVLAGAPLQEASVWPTAAVVGTLLGDYMESAAAKHLGAITQKPVTTQLPNGLVVSGTADMIFPDRNVLADCKTKDRLAGVKGEGASLENKIQVSIYTLGCVQMGLLTEGASAILVYVDRSGEEQTLYEIELSWDEILTYIDVVVSRLDDVLEAQEHIDKGELEWARALRDKTPPFCYSERVLCPFRDLCWKGSEWVPDEEITDENLVATVARYVAARDKERAAQAERAHYKEQLRGVSGLTPEGYSVTWPDGERALYVTKVRRK